MPNRSRVMDNYNNWALNNAKETKQIPGMPNFNKEISILIVLALKPLAIIFHHILSLHGQPISEPGTWVPASVNSYELNSNVRVAMLEIQILFLKYGYFVPSCILLITKQSSRLFTESN